MDGLDLMRTCERNIASDRTEFFVKLAVIGNQRLQGNQLASQNICSKVVRFLTNTCESDATFDFFVELDVHVECGSSSTSGLVGSRC